MDISYLENIGVSRWTQAGLQGVPAVPGPAASAGGSSGSKEVAAALKKDKKEKKGFLLCLWRVYSITVGRILRINGRSWRHLLCKNALHSLRRNCKHAGKGDGIKIDLAPPSGTRDFFPDEMRKEDW